MKTLFKPVLRFFAKGLTAVFIGVILVPIFVVVFAPLSKIRKLVRKGRKPTVLWGPSPSINFYFNSKAVALYGYSSKTFVYVPDKIMEGEKYFDYDVSRWAPRSLSRYLGPFFALPLIALCYDIVHIFYNGTFFSHLPLVRRLELPLLKLAGKKVIAIPFGSDVRLEGITRMLRPYNVYHMMSHDEVVKTYGSDRKIKNRIEYIEKYADTCLSIGDMIHYTPRCRHDIFYLAIDLDHYQPVYETHNKKVLIVHSANHRQLKGTSFLIDVVERIKREGYPVEVVLVEGLTSKEANEHYRNADIIVYDLILGWHGFFGIEAMALGKPLLTYIQDVGYLPAALECPLINVNPDSVYDNLVMLIKDAKLRIELGKKGRRYVEQIYSLEAVGKQLDKLYNEIWG